MKAISIRGPWWWFILHLPAGQRKEVENRDWQRLTTHRGETLIHASGEMTHKEFDAACEFAQQRCGIRVFPRFDALHRGGIVGIVNIVGHVKDHPSQWFMGPTALVLENPYPEPFRPCKGMLGFFEPEFDSGWRPAGTIYKESRTAGR